MLAEIEGICVQHDLFYKFNPNDAKAIIYGVLRIDNRKLPVSFRIDYF